MPIVLDGYAPGSGEPGRISLADVEREVARRAAKYRELTVASSTPTTVVVSSLTSTIEGGGDLADLWLLRRVVSTADRVRQVASYEPSTGTLPVERSWAAQPAAGEAIELHYLHPADELRPAVLAGLKRCYRLERKSVTLTGTNAEQDLTALLPWITDPRQVYRLEWDHANAVSLPTPAWWWDTFEQEGHVWLRFASVPVSSLLVTARRPLHTRVNGADSTTGPTADSDTLEIDLEYAAAAGHVECWRLAREKLLDGAKLGLFPSQEEAAVEFTRQARRHFHPPAGGVKLSAPFGLREVP